MSQAVGFGSSAGGIGVSSAAMASPSTFSGWNFTAIWAISGGENHGFPYLASLPPAVAPSRRRKSVPRDADADLRAFRPE